MSLKSNNIKKGKSAEESQTEMKLSLKKWKISVTIS